MTGQTCPAPPDTNSAVLQTAGGTREEGRGRIVICYSHYLDLVRVPVSPGDINATQPNIYPLIHFYTLLVLAVCSKRISSGE